MKWEWVGYLAAFCTTASFIPQVLHILRTRDTAAISLGMYSIFTFGVAMWLTYGLILRDAPMTIANAITLVLALFILCYTVRDRIRKP